MQSRCAVEGELPDDGAGSVDDLEPPGGVAGDRVHDVGDRCAGRGILTGISAAPHARVPRRVRQQERRILNRKQVDHRRALRARQVLEGCEVVEDEDAPAMGTDDEVVLALLDREVMNRHRRDAGTQPDPVRTAVDRVEDTVFRPDEEQIALAMMLANDLHRTVRRQVPGDGRPGPAEVRALQDIRSEIIAPVPIERGIQGPLGETREGHPAHVRRLGHGRELLRARPRLPAVPAHRDDAVIAARCQ